MKQPKLSDLKIDTKGTKSLRKMMNKSKKIKITLNVDQDLLLELKQMAEESGTPYQSLLNKFLKEALSVKKSEVSRLDRLEREVDRLKKRISA